MFFLYIDPGTGSALFSILIGAAATLYFVGRAVIIKLKVILSGGKVSKTASKANPFVIYNEGRQYNNVFQPVIDEFERRNIALLYLTSFKEDPNLTINYQSIKCEFIGEGNKAFSYLNMLNADFVLMTTPSLDVYQLKRSKGVKHYSHVLHSPGDATMYRLFGIDYFDSILLTGDYQGNDIRILERQRNLPEKQLITVGCTYLDVYQEKISKLPVEEEHPFTVLVSPSWGPSSLLSKYGEKLLDSLASSSFRIIIRPHPQSKKSESAMLEKLTSRYQGTSNFIWDYETDNIFSLSKSDIMISDYSGIIYDYLFLFNKPVIYVNHGLDMRLYDADDLGENAFENLWQFKTLREVGIELKESDFQEISEIIKNASDSEELKAAREKAKNAAWQYCGEAGKRIADFMVQTRQNLQIN